MTQQQKFTKVIERAVERGYDFGNESTKYTGIGNSSPKYVIANSSTRSLIGMLFSHDFAKAYWGVESCDSYGDTFEEYKQEIKKGMKYPIGYEWTNLDMKWGFSLKGAVLSDDPIDYYYKNKGTLTEN